MSPVCLITGASAGIGAALAREFAKHGHALVLTARREAKLEALADEIAAEGHARPLVIAADLGAAEGTAHLAEALAAARLEPSAVVNNAGFGLLGEAAELDLARQLAMIDLNARTVTDLSLRWIESIKRHRGAILNVASITGFMPGPGMAVYHGTKAYVVSFTEALHQELKSDGIRVCALCPGPVETEFMEVAGVPVHYVPRYLTRTAGRVAQEGYEGLMAGRRVVVPGAANRIAIFLPRLLPRALMLAIFESRWKRVRGG
ncbi:MAG: SDR family oxidoreductase [Pseudolabrys sp.]